ncbi:MAG: acyl-CoA carboxylase subunit beta [Actinomycetota bacterium]|jgi:acetyl-CoA carboxylase carboxyl transferase subunit beta|nr:acyl-CoA carboxylase subunit beta [Actinomycetota bacterium]
MSDGDRPLDWRGPLLAGGTRLDVRVAGRDPARWPGYAPRTAVSLWRLEGAVAAAWDFSTYGGSFGEDDATVLEAAAATAVAERLPLLTLVRSGGVRLQEGMAALVGIPRARIALRTLADAGLAHLSVADAPTTGGVWIGVTCGADLRVAVEGATVAFAGPRVVEAFTGVLPAADSHTADSAYAAGLVDALLPGEHVVAWLRQVLTALTPDPQPVATPAPVPAPDDRGREQVERVRSRTQGGRRLLGRLLTDVVELRAPRGDATVAAVIGRLSGHPVVGIAVAAEIRQRPTPDGYRLATRAYRLAARLRLPVLSLVDTPGADPGTASEDDGVASAMADAMEALLACPTPTVALVHGEGGSGGALAAATADVVLMTPDSYFAAIGPEGAAAALRKPAEECADLMRITPNDLLTLGFADAVAAPEDTAAHLRRLVEMSDSDRLVRRHHRWGAPLPGHL